MSDRRCETCGAEFGEKHDSGLHIEAALEAHSEQMAALNETLERVATAMSASIKLLTELIAKELK